MRNLVNVHLTEAETIPAQRIPRQRRPLTEREFNRHVRKAGLRQRDLTVKVARAMKYGGSK